MNGKEASVEEELERTRREREDERTGRIRAEREAKELREQLERARTMGAGDRATRGVYPIERAATARSCFHDRFGTPRATGLAPSARAIIRLEGHVPGAALEGLEEFTHVWIVYVFHKNTKAIASGGATVKGKVEVPRLSGRKVGALATRSPHRPAPIGLTRAEVERVDPERKELVVSGADIVDGTPILDVKPLVPWRDEGAAQIPEWAAWHGEEDTLCIGCHLSEGCEEALKSAWQQTSHGKVLESEGRFVRLVKEMLALDIRSYRNRRSDGGSSLSESRADRERPSGRWHVHADGVEIGFDVPEDGPAIVRDAAPLAPSV